MTALLSSSQQMLDRMSRQQSELEGRLDDMLSRIAMETQEIKELEQQLTDGEETIRLEPFDLLPKVTQVRSKLISDFCPTRSRLTRLRWQDAEAGAVRHVEKNQAVTWSKS